MKAVYRDLGDEARGPSAAALRTALPVELPAGQLDAAREPDKHYLP